MEDKNRLVFNLQQQVDETKTESEYQLRLKDNKYMEDARLAKKKFQAEINELKQTISESGFLSFCLSVRPLPTFVQQANYLLIIRELFQLVLSYQKFVDVHGVIKSCSKTRGKGSFHILQGFLGIPEVIFIC